jgi:hypothetical protein
MGSAQLEAARTRRRSPAQLRKELQPLLGDIEPAATPSVQTFGTRSTAGAQIDALSLTVEDGISVPLLLLRPPGPKPAPVVVAIAQAGKEGFLANRTKEIDALLQAGIAVCLPDVRATGETAPAAERADGGPYHRIAQTEFDLGRSLLGSRLKDLRTVLAYLRQRPDLDRQEITLWGDSFALPNPANLWVDELENEGAPQIQHRSEPLGSHLALLAALYEDDVRAVAARGGLAGYLTVLENPFAYLPLEDVILGVLKTGDVADIAAALAPRPLLLEGLVNGRNIRVPEPALTRILQPAQAAYRESQRLTLRVEPQDLSAWLIRYIVKDAP